jgi:hypothetical protein
MKSFIAIATLAVGANALVGRSDSCCFHLTASGDKSGSLGQLSDGQVRVGDDNLSAAKFCLSGGVITDSEGRGCVVTSKISSSSSTSSTSSSIANQYHPQARPTNSNATPVAPVPLASP